MSFTSMETPRTTIRRISRGKSEAPYRRRRASRRTRSARIRFLKRQGEPSTRIGRAFGCSDASVDDIGWRRTYASVPDSSHDPLAALPATVRGRIVEETRIGAALDPCRPSTSRRSRPSARHFRRRGRSVRWPSFWTTSSPSGEKSIRPAERRCNGSASGTGSSACPQPAASWNDRSGSSLVRHSPPRHAEVVSRELRTTARSAVAPRAQQEARGRPGAGYARACPAHAVVPLRGT